MSIPLEAASLVLSTLGAVLFLVALVVEPRKKASNAFWALLQTTWAMASAYWLAEDVVKLLTGGG